MRTPTEEMSQKKLEEELTEAKTNNEIIAAIGKIYWMIYRLNLNDGTYENISVGMMCIMQLGRAVMQRKL